MEPVPARHLSKRRALGTMPHVRQTHRTPRVVVVSARSRLVAGSIPALRDGDARQALNRVGVRGGEKRARVELGDVDVAAEEGVRRRDARRAGGARGAAALAEWKARTERREREAREEAEARELARSFVNVTG